MKNIAKVVFLLLFASIGIARTNCPKDFIHAHKHKLCLNGNEYRQIGFNAFDIFLRYLNPKWAHETMQNAKEDASHILAELGGNGFGVIRIMDPFYPQWLEEVFFDRNKIKQNEKRRKFIKTLKEFLDDCDKHDIKVIYSFYWNPQNLGDIGRSSINESMTDFESLGFIEYLAYTSAVINEFKDRKTIAMWEVTGNEWNLLADLQMEKGLFKVADGTKCFEVKSSNERLCDVGLTYALAVRDHRNNFTTQDLVKFSEKVVKELKKIDQNHLITSGFFAPRQDAWHLNKAVLAGNKPDWTKDSQEQRSGYIEFLNSPFETISIHFYDKAQELPFYFKLAKKLKKPLVIGELGFHIKLSGPQRYDYRVSENMDSFASSLLAFIESDAPIAIIWSYGDERAANRGNFMYLRYGKTDRELKIIEDLQNQLQNKFRRN